MTADTVGGVWTYAMELARALYERDVRILLFTMGKQLSTEQRNQVEQLPHVTPHETEFKLEWMDDPWEEVRCAGDALLELEKTFSPDVIHLNGYAHAALRWNAPTLVVCHSCVLSWCEAVNPSGPVDERWNHYREQVTAGLRSTGFVVAPTQAMLSSIENSYGALEAPSAVVRNAIGLDLFRPGCKQPYIFSAGRLWDPAKNIGVLRGIADRLDWPVYAAADTLNPKGDSGFDATSGNYCSLGFQPREEIACWLSAASVYCAPARYEPFGLAILEAAISGCALVLGDIPSLRELWEGAAVFVDPDDVDGIAATLGELTRNSSHRHKCGRRARMRGMEFMPSRMAAQYHSIYEAMRQKTTAIKTRCPEGLACAS
jgi:glycosyltransferase involved in cell wall biosynthesis